MLWLGQICWASILVEEGWSEIIPKKALIISGFANNKQTNKLSSALYGWWHSYIGYGLWQMNKEACCYQFCIAVCNSERSAVITLWNLRLSRWLPASMLEHAHWMVPNHLQMDTLRGKFSFSYFMSFLRPSFGYCRKLLNAADCFTLVLASFWDCVCLCFLTCAFILLYVYMCLLLIWGSPSALGNYAVTAAYAFQASWFITLALPHAHIYSVGESYF